MDSSEKHTEELRQQIARGFKQIECGKCVQYVSGNDFAEDIKKEGRKLLARRTRKAEQ